jgi:prepilin-type N-terminal cleavage/methylation domain-containing protein
MPRLLHNVRRNTTAGFTLTELLCGLALGGILCVLLLELLAGTTRQADTARRKSEARLITRPLLQKLGEELASCQVQASEDQPFGVLCRKQDGETFLALAIPAVREIGDARSSSMSCIVYHYDQAAHTLKRVEYHTARESFPVGTQGLAKRTASIPALHTRSAAWFNDARLQKALQESPPLASGVMGFSLRFLERMTDPVDAAPTTWELPGSVPAAVQVTLELTHDPAAALRDAKENLQSFQVLLPIAGALTTSP